jgi:hypothetical protein
MSTKNRILYYLNNQGWVSGTQLEAQARDWGTKSSVISRRARELANEGKLERSLQHKAVQYRIQRMSSLEANAYLKKLDEELLRERQGSMF